MGMTGQYVRFAPAEYARALADPAWAVGQAYARLGAEPVEQPDPAAARALDIDKMWHGLAFLLDRVEFPVDVVFGDAAVPGAGDWGCGAPRHLAPERVREAADALARIPAERLLEGVGPADLAREEVYPSLIWERGESLRCITAEYERLVPFFGAAAREGDGMFMWLH
ncbi:YfbM family protein [Streptomyces sp. URMC 126]|uniref:YfbM family protein n=1 Tax=Streptomyces sp. URMC 126 TaxID=3423401 RepID=UPI003F1E3164